ncbi:LysR substrate-binding domain-containing protein [Paraburkholderia saeva]|uniref:HTH-type transcriptional activator CmpR n=2 Tax=Paraburkholderia saeva TaxID=2777537 RepID=A0A9N8X1M9_9BURK|nr:LysR substrate-binding domain-containing protein [Paraburkholderia saeva]CAG4887387.1 HTH-type transcriptional activator CmpR [Paraburkholderia saeva]CAG4894957.1 HTH-type transcriptional activator CmpR [Paraburkholderia saeva]CAG4898124.1 HTH-type transcriptional activator CmpR [Paraburkholderia saeva]
MRLTQLRSFYAVGKHGSVTAAARALHVSQPTVTTQVRDLEESYGVELFHRSGRRIMLTAAGETLYAIAQRMFGNEQEAIDFLKESAGLTTGIIRVGAVGPLHAMEIVAAFHLRYPGLRVSMRLGNSEEIVRSLLSYETDVALLAQYGSDPRLYYLPYRLHPLVIIVPATHRLARRRSVRLEELRAEPMIMREPGSTTRKALEDALRHHDIQPNFALEVGSREAVREAVILGLGIAAVSEREHVDDARLRKLTIRGEQVLTHAHVACLAERKAARLVRAFLDVVNQILVEQGGEVAAREA